MLAAALTMATGGLCPGAEDKNGVNPNVISLPKGPGSVEGLGEAFQPSLNTGTGKHALKISVPPGTAGHQPEFALVYDGGGGNGIAGMGWSMPSAFVQRQTDKGVPRYVDGPNGTDDDLDGEMDEDNEIDRFIDGASEELVPVQDGAVVSYFCKNEGSFMRYRKVGDHWEARMADGTLLVFGESSLARISDPADVSRVFRWLLESEIDTRGNTIRYRYATFTGTTNFGQTYLQAVEYGAGSPDWGGKFHFVWFEYEDRNDWFEDCRSGFSIRTGKRLREIVIGTQGVTLENHAAGDFNHDATSDALNRIYRLAYQPGVSRSLLASVTQIGMDGVTSLPPASYGYTVSGESATVSAADALILSENAPPLAFDVATVDFTDLNGDGLPDLLRTSSVGDPHQVYFNQGETMAGGAPAIQWSSANEVATTPGGTSPWDLGLGQNQTVLSDVDGDGLSDLVQMSPYDTYYYPCRPPMDGSARWGARTVLAAVDFIPPSPFGSGGSVRTMDVNFDKRTDIVQSSPTGGGFGYQVWFNLADDTFSQRATFSPETGYDLAAQGVHFADLNGDRLQDVASIWATRILFTASLGHGLFQEEVAILIPDFTLTTEELSKAALRDINGDGLADLVVDRPVPQTLWIWFNRGNRTLSDRCSVTGLPASYSASTAVRWVDLNGNGTTDIVIGDSGLDPTERIQAIDLGRLFGFVPRPWLLNCIKNGIGRVETLLYDTSTTFALQDGAGPTGYRYAWPHQLPFPVEVVKEIQTDDSLGNRYVTRFCYHDGFYDPDEKQFRGFARVEQIDVGDETAPTLESRFTFDVGAVNEVLKGKVLRQIAATESGSIFSDSGTSWNIKKLHAGLDGRAVVFAHARLKTDDILECGLGTPRRIETGFDYDNFGNETERWEYGVVEGTNRAAFNDERVTVTQFAVNLASWMLRYPKRVELRTLAGNTFARKDSFYDDESFGGANFGDVTTGNLTMVREWPDPAKPAEFLTSSRTRFDPFGNPVDLLDPLYGKEPGHWRKITYDADFHTFPETETIFTGGTPASLVVNAAYDKGLGVMTSATEFNGNPTGFGYDPLARLVKVIKPGDSAQFPTENYSYHLAENISGVGLLNWIESQKRETVGGGTFDSRTFVDGLGRTLQVRTESEKAGQVVVNGATLFNARREKWRVFQPYFESGTLDYAPPVATGYHSGFQYDATLRGIETINPPETEGGASRSSRTVYEPLVFRLFDEEDNHPGSSHHNTPHVQYKDGLGRLVGVDEINQEEGNPVTYPTRYRYDLNDQLTGITDSQNNIKSIVHDGLKRMTFMDDPDRGVMNYTYDDASNLTDTIDAKAQHIVMTYDGANRIKTEDYLDAAGLTPDVSYYYDTATSVPAGDGTISTSSQQLGKLVKVSDLSGEEHLSYDTRGRTEWRIKRVRDPRTGVLASYKSSYDYDSLDRLTTLAYPDGDTVGYGYNDRNLPHTINGGPGGFIIPNMTYKASGQLDTATYGNGVATSYQYDPRLRLRSLVTQQSTLNSQLISFSYQFDAASNITRIDDHRASIPTSDPRKNTQVFGYDDLYRLTSVQYPAILSGSPGSITYAYDRIGNMLGQTSNITATENGLPLTNLGTMSYGGTMGPSGRIGRNGNQPGPHALTAVSGGSRSYPYDANGNMEAIDGLACTWDFKDRLIAVENAQMHADYTYDYTDRRITKKVWQKSGVGILPASLQTTLYVDRTYEVREDASPVKYIWNGETRVARVTTNLNATQRIQRFSLHPGWNLCTLAVALTNAGTQIGVSPVQNVFRYDVSTQTYHTIATNESLPAGTLLRLFASAAGELAVRGTLAAAASVSFPAGRHWVGNATFQPLDLATALPADAPLWFWQSSTQAWRYRLPNALGTASDAPARLEPGEAIFAHHTAAFALAPADPTLEVRYYHQDHLGSSSVMSDATGQLVSESTFYPFGHPRNEQAPRNVKEAYGFTQKERDGESGLNYFETRFLVTGVSRFASVDPMMLNPDYRLLTDPQQYQAYSYSRSNPLRFIDSTGRAPTVSEAIDTADQILLDPYYGPDTAIGAGRSLAKSVPTAVDASILADALGKTGADKSIFVVDSFSLNVTQSLMDGLSPPGRSAIVSPSYYVKLRRSIDESFNKAHNEHSALKDRNEVLMKDIKSDNRDNRLMHSDMPALEIRDNIEKMGALERRMEILESARQKTNTILERTVEGKPPET